MKKILLSLSMIAVVAVVVLGATGAFFSDTETSTGNTFTAGAIDLTVDSEQHYNNAICVNGLWQLEPNGTATVPQYPVLGEACGGTWVATDLGASNKFFNFVDIKPGDEGENTISLHVLNNDAWACAAVSNLTSNDNTQTEPESQAPLDTDDMTSGELDDQMIWKIWRDDGDNVWETGEEVLAEGNPTNGVLALYDSVTNSGAVLPGGTTVYLGVSWSLPSTSGNETQTDSLTGDISFEVVQSRNNGSFKCSDLGQQPQIVWVETTQADGDASIVDEGGREDVLKLVTIADNSSRVRWTNSTLNLDLDLFTGISFESNQVSANDPINGNATMRLTIDLDGDINTADTQEITYEPYYNYTSQNPSNSNTSMVTGTWQTWNTTLANGKFWGNGGFLGTTPSGGAYGTNITLSQVLTAHPSAKIVGISLGMGTWNQNQVVLVDNLMINGSPVSLEN